MWEFVTAYWPYALAAVERLAALITAVHAILNKRDSRAVVGWLGLIWLAPVVGSLFYCWIGINRLHRRGAKLQAALDRAMSRVCARIRPSTAEELQQAIGRHPSFRQLIHLVDELTHRQLLAGNSITPLIGGEQAYPAMLGAIGEAQDSINLSTYIFDYDRAGREFVDALDDARSRGVDVRVLVDSVGARYSRPTAVRMMRLRGIRCETFLPTMRPKSVAYANLRSHRKILVIDSRFGFTGGMNIREGCRLDWSSKHPVHDLHFRVEGPVTAHLQEAFAADWAFTTDEILSGDRWFPAATVAGDVWARGIPVGPDEDFDKLRLTLLGAIAVAQHRIDLITPYFLPDVALSSALNVAAMRGVRVRIVIPEKNNLHFVQWASTAMLWEVLGRGCRVYLSAPPFDHTKLLLIDDAWALVGSSNWDARSLRLNFEFNVECYSSDFVDQMSELFDRKLQQSREITLDEIHSRSFPVRLRDGLARLFAPYL